MAKWVIAAIAKGVDCMVAQLVKVSVLPAMRRVIAAITKSVDCMNRTNVTQLVKASVLPAVRRAIAAIAKNVNRINRTKATPIQPGREKNLYRRTVMLGGN